MAVFEVGENLFVVDLFEGARPFRSSAYFIRGPEPTLIETGSSNGHTYLIDGLKELGYTPQDLKHIVVTHAHLDHAGGAGLMMQSAPDAVLHAHPRAARHLIDPSRLDAGTRAVYGNAMDALYGPLLPVPSDRVVVQEDGSVLELGNGRNLTFYDTPGHAKHHMCVFDNVTRGIFSGDTVGIRYWPQRTGWDFFFGFPTTSPSDFDPDVMLASLDKLERLNPEVVYHTHFGPTRPAAQAFDFSRRGVYAIQNIIAGLKDDADPSLVEQQLLEHMKHEVAHLAHPVEDFSELGLDINLNAQGIIVYMQKKKAGKL